MKTRVRRVPEYKKVDWCEGDYYATSDGRVYSEKNNQFLKGSLTSGYLYVGLKQQGAKVFKRVAIHRIVCEAFHGPMPCSGMQVNHKNGNKLDNRPSNLEWMTQSQNIHHSWENGLAPYIADFNEERKCPIVGVDGIGHIICFFLSIKEAARNGHNEWQLHLCLQRPHRKHHGLFWRRMSDIIVALD